MKKSIASMVFVLVIAFSCNTGNSENPSSEASKKQASAPVSVLDSAKSTLLENSIKAFAQGNMDDFTSAMTDDIKFYYPAAGDSLTSKAAVRDYYTARWKVIDSIKLINPTYLAVDVHRSSSVQTGEWLMAWYSFQVNYKSGNGILLPIHTVAHLNASGKVDIMGMYYDTQKIAMAQRK